MNPVKHMCWKFFFAYSAGAQSLQVHWLWIYFGNLIKGMICYGIWTKRVQYVLRLVRHCCNVVQKCVQNWFIGGANCVRMKPISTWSCLEITSDAQEAWRAYSTVRSTVFAGSLCVLYLKVNWPKRTTQFNTFFLFLFLADPATSLDSNIVLGLYFPLITACFLFFFYGKIDISEFLL